jgi:hypothetical protein
MLAEPVEGYPWPAHFISSVEIIAQHTQKRNMQAQEFQLTVASRKKAF